MAICPKCSKEMSVQAGRMVCSCGYQYALPQRVPTYQELIRFIRDMDYEKTLECWMEIKDESL